MQQRLSDGPQLLQFGKASGLPSFVYCRFVFCTARLLRNDENFNIYLGVCRRLQQKVVKLLSHAKPNNLRLVNHSAG